MKPLAIDTNLLINVLQHDVVPYDTFRRYDRLLISATVMGEFRAGIESSRKGLSMLSKLTAYTAKTSVDVVPITDRTSELYAKVFQALRQRGRPIPQNDMWIAASALEHGAALATFDTHFKDIPMLTVEIP